MEERMGRLGTRNWTLIGVALACDRPRGARPRRRPGHDRRLQDHPLLPGAKRRAGPAGPSTFQAGAFPDAGSWSRFTYPNATEDLQIARTNFAAGLLGNPESVPKCPEAALQAGGSTCPAGSAIGSSRLDAVVAGTTSPRRQLHRHRVQRRAPRQRAGSTRRRDHHRRRHLPGFLDPVLHHAARRGRLRPDRHAQRRQPAARRRRSARTCRCGRCRSC